MLRGKSFCYYGMTIVEVLVVTIIFVIIASLTLPLMQLQQQREKEQRLKEILTYIRNSAIGLGNQADSNQKTDFAVSNSSRGYRNFVIKKLYAKIGVEPGFTAASAAFAIAAGTELGIIYPRNPAMLEYPIGYVARLPTDQNGGYTEIKITNRFIRKIPEHPFKDWYPNAHFEFKAKTYSVSGGPWFSLAPYPNATVWPIDSATGVIDVRSVGAGLSITGENTDLW